MARIDGLLKMLVNQGGDDLRLEAAQAPRFFVGEEPLRLFLPAMSADALREMFEPVVPAAQRGAFAAGGRISFRYAHAQLGGFTIEVRDAAGALRARIRREAPTEEATVVEPAPAPAPVVEVGPFDRLLAGLLSRAAEMGASDLHLADGEPPVVRVDGRLRQLDGAPVDVRARLSAHLDDEQLDQVEAGQSVDVALDVAGAGRVRANVYRCREGLAAAFRLLKRRPPSLDELNLPVSLAPAVAHPHGLVIVCGPTGCGKSTTLAALARHALRARGGVLVTLEDPVEYSLAAEGPGALVRQREIGRDVTDFAAGLRDALREDPDLLLVGEMRDRASIGLALTAAETGHLVLTSLHSRSTASAIERIVDAYSPERQRQIRVQLADALRVVVAQRLLPRADGRGRVPALEVLQATHGVASLIREGRTAHLQSALQSGGAEGMLPLERCLADLVRRGTVRLEDAEAAANDRAGLRAYLA